MAESQIGFAAAPRWAPGRDDLSLGAVHAAVYHNLSHLATTRLGRKAVGVPSTGGDRLTYT